MPLAIIGLMRDDAGIYFAAKLFSGNLPPLLNLPELAHPGKYYEILVVLDIIRQANIEDRTKIEHFFGKIYIFIAISIYLDT